jgi:uncharacterized membrane protein YdbT with pleckstrin-like domain
VPFPRKLLNDNEEVVLDLHPHWWFFAPPLLALVAVTALGLWAWADPGADWANVPLGVVVLGFLAWFVFRYMRWVTTNFVITSDRLIYRHGVLGKHGIEIPLDRVNTVLFSQTIFERVVGSGDIKIESASEFGVQAFSNVRHPSAVQNEIYRQIEANENRKFDRVGASAAAGTASVEHQHHEASISEQMRELKEMHQQGLVTEEEFAQKRQQLLDRM